MKGMTANLAFQRMTALAAPYLCSIPTVYWDSWRGNLNRRANFILLRLEAPYLSLTDEDLSKS